MRFFLIPVLVLSLSTTVFSAGVTFSGTLYGNTPDSTQGGVVAADLNRDGWPDMVIANPQGGANSVSVFLATGPGVFNKEADYSVATPSPDSPVAADLNGDFALDLIVRHWNSPKLSILWNNGDGTFRNGPTIALTNPASSFVVGNFNRADGLDIATVECAGGSTCSFNVYVGNNSGGFSRSQSVKMAGGAEELHVGDFDGDSKADLVLARTNQVLIWWGRGDGTFSAPSYLTPDSSKGVAGITVGDFNNDGRLDLVTSTFQFTSSFCDGKAYAYKNAGGRSFSLAWSSSEGNCAGTFRADLNGDLNQDVIFENGDEFNGFFIGLLGNGNGTLQTTPQSLPNPDDIAGVEVRDLNLDSRDDYIATTWLGGSAMVALQTGGYKNCTPPSSANHLAKICSPGNGATVSSPVLIRAAGNSPEGVIQLQVWIDGVKKAVRWSNQMANRFALSPGKHRIFVGAMDKWYLSTAGTTINITVQ